jgi:uncharacterized membrane protein
MRTIITTGSVPVKKMTYGSLMSIIPASVAMHSKRHIPSKLPVPGDRLLAILAVAAILALLLAPPHSVLDKADRAAFAVCHRIPDRSFTVAGHPLPLCARCSGTYLGALAGIAVLVLRGRGRASLLPAPRYLAVIGIFLAAWAVDGLNSFLTFFPGVPHLYEPHNLLRLATGVLEGLAIAALLLPAFNRSLWMGLPVMPSIGRWQDVAWLLAGGVLVAGGVASGLPFLLYPLALMSGIAVVTILGVVNGVFVLIILRRDGQVTGWRGAAPPLLIGLALAVIELAVVGLARAALEARIGSPW